MTLPLVPLQEQPVVALLLKEGLVSWSLDMDKYGGLKIYVVRTTEA
jgi:hypothetical protein